MRPSSFHQLYWVVLISCHVLFQALFFLRHVLLSYIPFFLQWCFDLASFKQCKHFLLKFVWIQPCKLDKCICINMKWSDFINIDCETRGKDSSFPYLLTLNKIERMKACQVRSTQVVSYFIWSKYYLLCFVNIYSYKWHHWPWYGLDYYEEL